MKSVELRRKYSEAVIARGENYIHNVESCIKIWNFLHAKVQGSDLYKTSVNIDTLEGECSCPYEHNCKHAVAAYIYHKKGKSENSDSFVLHLKNLSKEELINLIESLLPANPELIKTFSFRSKTDFNSLVDDFIDDFSVDNLENIAENFDCLNFDELIRILEYIE